MIVTYRPTDGAEQTWNFDPGAVPVAVAEVIENRVGMRFEEWVVEILAGSAKARRVLFWHLSTWAHPHLRLEDAASFTMRELTVERDLDELIAFADQIAKSAVDREIRDAALAEVEKEIAAKRAAGVVEAGKVSSPNGAPVTASTSPTSST